MIGAAIRRDFGASYPGFPWSPSERYPEFGNKVTGQVASSAKPNIVYRQFRNLLVDLECDIDNYGKKNWNPLGALVKPGNTVVIKPNLVNDVDDRQDCITTHPSVIRPIIDYVLIALEGKGSIIVGDAPASEAKFDVFRHEVGYQKLVDLYAESPVSVTFRDFRILKTMGDEGIWTGLQGGSGSEEAPGHITVNLGQRSVFCIEGCQDGRFHGGGYDIDSTIAHHHGEVQEYCVSKDALQADVLISVPKLKTHKKAGVTCCLKNLVGINCDKNYLPHFTMGPVNHGGDEMPRLKRRNALVMGAYNNIRQAFIGKHWASLGKPGAAFLNLISRGGALQGAVSSDDAVPLGDRSSGLRDQKDLGQWLHSKLSGQAIASGAWPGNETICRMILDLNQIALRSNRDGAIDGEQRRRKLFYVVDGVIAGVGNGPKNAIPVHSGILAAGYNGLQLDVSILQALGIDPWSIPLYDKARRYEWMYPEKGMDKVLADAIELKAGAYSDIAVVEPDGWHYGTLPNGAGVGINA